eukprot:42542_1
MAGLTATQLDKTAEDITLLEFTRCADSQSQTVQCNEFIEFKTPADLQMFQQSSTRVAQGVLEELKSTTTLEELIQIRNIQQLAEVTLKHELFSIHQSLCLDNAETALKCMEDVIHDYILYECKPGKQSPYNLRRWITRQVKPVNKIGDSVVDLLCVAAHNINNRFEYVLSTTLSSIRKQMHMAMSRWKAKRQQTQYSTEELCDKLDATMPIIFIAELEFVQFYLYEMYENHSSAQKIDHAFKTMWKENIKHEIQTFKNDVRQNEHLE